MHDACGYSHELSFIYSSEGGAFQSRAREPRVPVRPGKSHGFHRPTTAALRGAIFPFAGLQFRSLARHDDRRTPLVMIELRKQQTIRVVSLTEWHMLYGVANRRRPKGESYMKSLCVRGILCDACTFVARLG